MVFHNSFNISSLRWSVETKYVVNKWIYYVSVGVFASKHIVYRQFSLVASHGSQTKWIEARNKLPKIHKITVGSKRRNGNFTNHVWYVCVWIFHNNDTEFTPKKCAFYAKHNYWMSIFFFLCCSLLCELLFSNNYYFSFNMYFLLSVLPVHRKKNLDIMRVCVLSEGAIASWCMRSRILANWQKYVR